LIADGILPTIEPPGIRRVFIDAQILDAKISSWSSQGKETVASERFM
jgi:hypothetical protein